jgi:hypothetical protein
MSQPVKIILIVVGILAFIGIVCVGGLSLVGYFFVDHEGVTKSSNEGTEFGKTTDNAGCQTRVVEMIKPLRDTDINGGLAVSYFFSSCLTASRPTPKFCDGVPNAYADILNEHKGKDAECAKLGLQGSIQCRQIIDEKLDFCDAKR